jgi:Ribbon-helix-helix protein, copG family
VKKTSIYLEPSLDEALAKRAAEEGLTKAEFIRRGLASLVSKPKRPKLSIGVYAGDGQSAANNVDRWLAETGFGED